MEVTADKLIAILEQEEVVYQRLCLVASEMNEAIKAGSLDEVQRLTMQYDEYASQLEDFEEQRLEQCDALADSLDQHRSNLNVAALTRLLEQERAARLSGVRDRLRERIGELTSLNSRNHVLLNEGLANITATFEMYARSTGKGDGYSRHGRKDAQGVGRSIVNRIA